MKLIRQCICLLLACSSLAAGQAMASPPMDNPQVLYQFCQQSDCRAGAEPRGLVRGPDGAYYGITWYGGLSSTGGVVYRADPSTRVISVLHRFDENRDGSFPEDWLAVGQDGNLYGALGLGPNHLPGRFFRLTLEGRFSTLYTFVQGQSYQFDTAPVQDRQGNWYGTFELTKISSWIYRISRDGVFRVLNKLPPDTHTSGLVLAPDGNLYGTVESNDDQGSIFRITRTGEFTTLHQFDEGVVGLGARKAPLATGPDGALYGTVAGTMFRMTLDGEFTKLATFNDSPDPVITERLTLMPDGYFYAVREDNPSNLTDTAIVRFSTNGDYSELFVYPKDASFGQIPAAPLIRGFDNVLYGTNTLGGAYKKGTLFRFMPPATPLADRMPMR